METVRKVDAVTNRASAKVYPRLVQRVAEYNNLYVT